MTVCNCENIKCNFCKYHVCEIHNKIIKTIQTKEFFNKNTELNHISKSISISQKLTPKGINQ